MIRRVLFDEGGDIRSGEFGQVPHLAIAHLFQEATYHRFMTRNADVRQTALGGQMAPEISDQFLAWRKYRYRFRRDRVNAAKKLQKPLQGSWITQRMGDGNETGIVRSSLQFARPLQIK
jgi:hypothetical protein